MPLVSAPVRRAGPRSAAGPSPGTAEGHPTLADLEDEIRSAHQAGQAAEQRGLEHYRDAGVALIQARDLIRQAKSRDWLAYLGRVGIPQQRASEYILLAQGWDKLPPGGGFGLKGAIQYLRQAKAADGRAAGEGGASQGGSAAAERTTEDDSGDVEPLVPVSIGLRPGDLSDYHVLLDWACGQIGPGSTEGDAVMTAMRRWRGEVGDA